MFRALSQSNRWVKNSDLNRHGRWVHPYEAGSQREHVLHCNGAALCKNIQSLSKDDLLMYNESGRLESSRSLSLLVLSIDLLSWGVILHLSIIFFWADLLLNDRIKVNVYACLFLRCWFLLFSRVVTMGKTTMGGDNLSIMLCKCECTRVCPALKKS